MALRCLYTRCKGCGRLMWIDDLQVVRCGCAEFPMPAPTTPTERERCVCGFLKAFGYEWQGEDLCFAEFGYMHRADWVPGFPELSRQIAETRRCHEAPE
jgi:hypothetical protein